MRIGIARGGRSRKRSTLRRLLAVAGRGFALVVLLSFLSTLVLRWVPPLGTGVMLERRVAAWWQGEKYQTRYQWVRWERISPYAPLAVVASEDQRFADHHGFDVESIQTALAEHDRGRPLRGASTISQQVAKNVFLWSGRSFIRKGLEIYFTTLIELLWPKRRILEVYLNVVELGDGIFGVEAASQRFFKKPAARLRPDEAALLASVLPSPHRLHADRPSAYVEERRAFILQQMDLIGGLGYLKRLGGKP
jgi:monofunctional biosynthetic peptidoglycan transglycosylase